jgi:uncharacterized protein (TIGR02271 family)
MTEFTQAYEFEGRTLVDRDDDKIGTIDEVYTDREGGQAEWALVRSGMFGTKKTFVPLRGARPTGEDVRVPVGKDQVKEAPRVDADGQMSEAEEQALFEHYGVPYTTEGSTTATGLPQAGGDPGGIDAGERVGRPAPVADGEPAGRTGDDAMTRSEEELRVGTERRESGRVRLRKYVVTENVTQTVPVQREEVRVEREPITDANLDEATSGPEISEQEHEVTLHEERPVIAKETVPKERVRLATDTHTDEETVSEELRKERIEHEGDTGER